jgi:hypothetical protein
MLFPPLSPRQLPPSTKRIFVHQEHLLVGRGEEGGNNKEKYSLKNYFNFSCALLHEKLF